MHIVHAVCGTPVQLTLGPMYLLDNDPPDLSATYHS